MTDLVGYDFGEEAKRQLPPGWSVQSWTLQPYRLNVVLRHTNGASVMLELDRQIDWAWVLSLLAVAERCPEEATFCFERRQPKQLWPFGG